MYNKIGIARVTCDSSHRNFQNLRALVVIRQMIFGMPHMFDEMSLPVIKHEVVFCRAEDVPGAFSVFSDDGVLQYWEVRLWKITHVHFQLRIDGDNLKVIIQFSVEQNHLI
eukprot:GEMP01064202.1.p2 GENE.GEMP01064202.1~~GEMP01064202.1.p2  ORF type:complete len:111 (-),score=11.71 GEMP01064202.1:372-704(-)